MQIKSVLNGKEINLTGDNTIIKSNNFNVDKNGNMQCTNANISGSITSNDATITGGSLKLPGSYYTPTIVTSGEGLGGDYCENTIFPDGMRTKKDNTDIIGLSIGHSSEGAVGLLSLHDESGNWSNLSATQLSVQKVVQTSLEEKKKNFEKMKDNAIEIINGIDIYKYNLKTENDTDKKHIGFVIGDKYNYSKEVTSLDNTGVDTYSFTSLCCKAIQEQQAQIEELKKEIEKLKGEKNG